MQERRERVVTSCRGTAGEVLAENLARGEKRSPHSQSEKDRKDFETEGKNCCCGKHYPHHSGEIRGEEGDSHKEKTLCHSEGGELVPTGKNR